MGAFEEEDVALPRHCLAREPETGRVVIIIRGRKGYFSYSGNETPESYNYRHRLSYEQVEAMEYGSQLGFEADLADPLYVRRVRMELGLPIGPVERPARGVGRRPQREARLPAAAAQATRQAAAKVHANDNLAENAGFNFEFLPEFTLKMSNG